MTLEDRLKLQIGEMTLQILALQHEKDQLMAELAARPARKAKPTAPESK